MSEATSQEKPRGFAAIPAERQRELAAKGGREAHRQGVAHQFTKAEAKAAGALGGVAVARKLGVEHMRAIGRKGGAAVAKDRDHMRRIGRKGGDAISADRQHMAEIGKRGGESRASTESAQPVETSRNLYHEHLDVCRKCANSPHALCPVGDRLLRKTLGFAT